MWTKQILLLLVLFTQIIELIPKQELSMYTIMEDFIEDEYDLESLQLYPLIKLQKLNDVRIIRILQNISNSTSSTGNTTTTQESSAPEVPSKTDLDKQNYGFRIPMHSFSEDGVKGGGFVLYLIGIVYLYVLVYMIFRKFLFKIIEDLVFLIEESQELRRPIMYCLLNALMFLLITGIGILDLQGNYGPANAIGTDALNIFLLFGVIQYKYYQEQGQIDSWLYLRDALFYLIGLAGLTFLYCVNIMKWWVALFYLGYYILFFIVQMANASLKNLILLMLGLKNEDDSFNCEEQLKFKKRRESITELIERQFVNNNDEALKKKLIYMDNCLKQDAELKNNYEKYKIHAIFQKAIYKIIYALRNKQQFEKKQRSQFYADLFKKDKETDNKKSKFHQAMKKNENEQKSESQKLLENNQKGAEEDRNSEMNFDEQPNMNDHSWHNSSLNRNAQMHLDGNNERNEDEMSGKDQAANQLEEDEEEADRISLACPKGLIAKIIYVLMLPINFILYWFPDLSKKATVKRFAIILILGYCLLGISLFFIIEWTHLVCFAFSAKASTAGLSFGAIAISIPYFMYNIKIAKDDKEVDFMQSFLQLGIFKMGICLPLTWIISSIVFSNADLNVGMSPKSFGVVLIIFTVMLFVSMIITVISKFQFSKKIAVIYLIFYFSFFIASIVIMEAGSS